MTTLEDAVTLNIRIQDQEVKAILDTGATPCVIDRGTIERLKLSRMIKPEPSKVYGQCNSPVRVLGHIMAEIRVRSHKPLLQKLQVLDSEEPTVLFGRQFMRHLSTISFDFQQSRIKIGEVWEPYETAVYGATPLARVQVAKQDEELETTEKAPHPLL